MYLLAVHYVLKIVDITDVILILQETVRRLCPSVCLAGPCALNAHRQLESSSCPPGVCLSFHFIQMESVSHRKNSALQNRSQSMENRQMEGCWLTQHSARAVCSQLSTICSHHMDVFPPGQKHKWGAAEGHWKPQCWAAWKQQSFSGGMSNSDTHVLLAKWIMMSCFHSVL